MSRCHGIRRSREDTAPPAPRLSTADYLPKESWWTRTDKPFSELCAAEQARMVKSPLGAVASLSYEIIIGERRTLETDPRAPRIPAPPTYPRGV